MTNEQTEARAIARFRIDWEHDDTGYPDLVRVWSDDGPFVSYEDHATDLAAKDAELAAVKVSNNKWLAKWERAEARLAEANKAQNYLNDAVFAGLDHLEIARRAKILVNAARRAREAQGGE